MTLNDALALVLSLAEENALDKRDAEMNEQEDEYDRQQEALALVTAHAVRVKEEGANFGD